MSFRKRDFVLLIMSSCYRTVNIRDIDLRVCQEVLLGAVILVVQFLF